MTGKHVRAQYTQEFKMEAVRQVQAGQVQAVMAKVLGIRAKALTDMDKLRGAVATK